MVPEEKQTHQKKIIKSTKETHAARHMTFEEGAQNIYWRKAVLSINSAGKSECPNIQQ